MTALVTRAEGVEPGWVPLVGPAAPPDRRARPPRVRDAVLQVAAIGVVLVVLVGVVGSLVIRRLAEQQSVHDVAELTDVLAESVVQPALTDAMADNPAAASAVLDRVVMPSMRNSLLVRVKVWNASGLILYSDEARLVGRRFTLDDEAREAFASPRTTADVSDLNRPENTFERGNGKLLEVYRPVWTPRGTPLLLETYFRYDAVHERSVGLWRGFGGILISSIAALIVLVVPLVGFLLSRARRAHREKERMAQRALAASDEERRRIGASLHDGVVQQLVAASFDLSGRAQQAHAAGDRTRAAELGEVAGTVRGTVAGLRSLLVEIYPPAVGTAGLATALRDLAASLVGSRAEVVLDVDEAVAAEVTPCVAEDVFRVVQECLRNAIKHASAHTITVTLRRTDTDEVRVEVDDDGTGFDPSAAAAQGHLGLSLMADAARRCGAQLSVRSRPGHGTRFRLDVPRA